MEEKKLFRIENESLLRLPLIIVALFMISFFILFYIDSRISELKKQEIINNEKRVIDLNIRIISNDVISVINDLHLLEGTYGGYLKGSLKLGEVEEIWSLISEHSGAYEQLRFIDTNGNEKIKIRHINQKSYISLEQELKNKKDEDIFYETEKISKDQHYISKLNLNYNDEKTIAARKPMISFSSKIYNAKDEYIGIIIISYLAEGLLNDFKNISLNSTGEIYLINSAGYGISGANESTDRTLINTDREKSSFKSKYPLEWSKINKDEREIFSTNGLFIWDELKFEDMHYSDAGKLKQEKVVISGGGNIRILSFINKNSKEGYIFSESIIKKILRIIKANLLLFVLIILIGFMIEIMIVISENAYKKMRDIAEYDGLTKVYNRRAGMEKLEKLVAKDTRRKANKISICFVDVNGLKQVNDILGHENGDELILTVASTIKRILREDDLIIRFGGDEFIIVFLEANTEIAENVWKRINEEFEKINANENRKYKISVSHGIVESDAQNDRAVDKIIKSADEKMYEEKKKIKTKDFYVIKREQL